MGFPESSYAQLDAEFVGPRAARWHAALAVVLAVAAISVGLLIAG